MYHLAKRIFDLFLACILVVVLFPLLCLLSLLIYLFIGSPIFFRQQRPGKDKRLFYLFKFRTMSDDCDENGRLLPDEQRITRLGKFLRKFSFDELPQLFNVIKGDVSFVGPRPLLVKYLALYSDEQARRHNVKPGITGWAQVNGRNALSWEEKFNLDLHYVDNQSFYLDLKILVMTLKKVVLATDTSHKDYVTMPEFTGGKSKNEE